MEFKIDIGEDEIIDPALPLPALIQRIITLLNNLEDGRLINTRKLAVGSGVMPNTLYGQLGHPALDPYKTQYNGNKNLYGNPATIREFKKVRENDR